MLPDEYLEIACQNLPTVNRVISDYGQRSLSHYLKGLASEPMPAFQKMDDILNIVKCYATSLLGTSVAEGVTKDLAERPVVLTANHHGIDYFAQSIQGSLLFGLQSLAGIYQAATITIFSCGSIPLDNLTYPQGVLVYHVKGPELVNMPQKLPIHPNKQRRRLVSRAAPFKQGMLKRAQQRLDKLVAEGKVATTVAEPLHRILEEDYGNPFIKDLPDYSQQAVVMNNNLWKRMFTGVAVIPDLVCLELEKIAAPLLEKDLNDSESLAWPMMFDPLVREQIIVILDGKRSCWETSKLRDRLKPIMSDQSHQVLNNGCGTHFFWGVSIKDRRIPLFLDLDNKNGACLRGVDDHSRGFEIPFTQAALIEGLHTNRLLPSLFSSFLVISLARGFTCAGGYFQGEYLPVMQEGVVKALTGVNGYDDMARKVAQVSTGAYLSGMLSVMRAMDEGYLIPAGPVEIISGGGLTPRDIERMLDLTVREAHLAALFETVPDILPVKSIDEDWQRNLAADCYRLLADRVIIK